MNIFLIFLVFSGITIGTESSFAKNVASTKETHVSQDKKSNIATAIGISSISKAAVITSKPAQINVSQDKKSNIATAIGISSISKAAVITSKPAQIRKISIENLTSNMNWTTRELSISWHVNSSFKDDISFYIIYIRNDSLNCLRIIYNIQGKTYVQMTNKSEYCSENLNVSINSFSTLNETIPFKNKISKFSIELYGGNQSQNQKLNDRVIEYQLEKPTLTYLLEFKERGENYLILKWRANKSKNINETIMGYKIKYLNVTLEFHFNKSEANITKLNHCSRYCFNISTFNDAGSSPDSKEYCNFTLAPNLVKVKLENISSGYEKFRVLNWTYSGSEKCPIKYQLEYWFNHSIMNRSLNNNSRSHRITNLVLNKIYSARIRPIAILDTNNKIKNGEYSNVVQFYTGIENVSISNLNLSMNWIKRELSLSWNINQTLSSSLSNYIIEISDQKKGCIERVIYQNNFYNETTNNIEPLKSCENQTKLNVTFNENFLHKIFCCNKTINVSIAIFGTNLKGRHMLNKENITIEMKKPDPIKNITVYRKDLQSFNLTLVKSDRVDQNKPVMGYRIKYIKDSKCENATNVTEPYFNASNLHPCTKYCFDISTYNDAGFSSDINHCVSTKATNLSEVKLTNISNGYRDKRQINWTYNGNNTCPVSYTVEYWIKNFHNTTKVERINETRLEIAFLKLNEIYQVRVFPSTDFDTVDGRKIGNHSNIVEFFTGEENIFISNLTYSMDWISRELSISWNINKTFAQSLFNYIINIFDHSNNWARTIIYQNSSKDTTNNIEPLKSCENQTKVNATFNENFLHKIFCCNKTINISIEIFGTNLKGSHMLNKDNITIKMQKPDPIKNITIYRKDLQSFNLTLVKSDRVDQNKPVMGYRIKYIKDSKWENATNVTEPYFKESNLHPCTKYCFDISTYNDAGFSKDINHCVITDATNLSEVKLTNISNGYRNKRQINWTYKGNRTCPISYKVEYWIKNLHNKTKKERINETRLEIDYLKLNEIYQVQVFPATEFDTADGRKIGNHSNIVEFFTGEENITVEDFKVEYKYNEKKFNLVWSLNETLNLKIDAYIIVIKNAQNVCCAVIERRESSLQHNSQFYIDENQKLMDQYNCTTNSDATKTYNATVNYFEVIDYETSANEREYVIELYTFNKLGFQRVQSLNVQIQIPANSGRAAVVSILAILIIGCLIYLSIRNREKLTNYLPFLSLLPFHGQSKLTNSEKPNQQAIQMNEEKSQLVLDERFLDCNTLNEFLNKIDEYQRSLTDFPNYVLFMKENKDVRLIQEYGKLNNLAATLEHQLKLTKFIGKSPFNLKKNRFRNILPFDQNLVYLKSKSAPDNYLNASYIPFSTGDGSIEYIASQGPIDSTISDFILMIWEQNITCIVMLTRTYEDDKFKCLQYWPDDSNEIHRYGSQKEFLVAKLYEKEETSYFERKFSLKNSITHEERIIYHIHMHMWMDFSAPDLKDFCSVLSRFQDIRETIVNSPFLVHCSAGVGRTGTFICIDRIVRLINKGQQHIDVFKSVMELRASRNLLVQRHSQYIFIHEFLNFYIQKHLSNNVQVVSTV